MNDEKSKNGIIRILPGDELDLHHFHPRDVKMLLEEFISMNSDAGISEIRVVHGKGKSVLKQTVRSELERNPAVLDFNDEKGNWGATIIRLRQKPSE